MFNSSVAIRPNGRYRYIIELGNDPVTGKRRQDTKSGFLTEHEAEMAKMKKLLEYGAGTYIAPTKKTVKEYFENWLIHKESQVKGGTLRNYHSWTYIHVIPNLGNVALKELQPYHLDYLYISLRKAKKPLSTRSINHIHGMIKDALNHAVLTKLIIENPAKIAKPPRCSKVELEVWDEHQLVKFLDVSKTESFQGVFLILATTGMRVGEALALRWSDINLTTGFLSVRRTYSKTFKGYAFSEPKTRSSIRNIPLPVQTIQFLIQHKKQQNIWKKEMGAEFTDMGLVNCSQKGTPIDARNLARQWSRIIKREDLKRIRMHDLRHTHATLLLRGNVHVKIVSERLGHSSVDITMDTYSHLLPGMQETAVTAFERVLNVPIEIEGTLVE
jgi:integrase